MMGRVELNTLLTTKNAQHGKEFRGVSPEFFGPPGPKDKKADMYLCSQLGIDPAGMDRISVKADILSKLTGKPVDQMRDFYNNVGELDMKKDLHALKRMGIEPSYQPDMMKARAENKAMIVNGWIKGKDDQKITHNENLGKIQEGKKPHPPADPMIIALLRQYGLQPTGSREGDLQALMKAMNTDFSNLQNINNGLKPEKPGKSGNRPPPKTPPAVSAFMQSIGLQPTNSKEGDFNAITAKLQEMEAQAKSDSQKQNVAGLKATFASLL